MKTHRSSPSSLLTALSISALLALTSCGGGGGGGGSSSGGTGDAIQDSLDDLGVNTTQTPREGEPGVDMDDDYTPFGKCWELATTRELMILGGMPRSTGSAPVSIIEVTDDDGNATEDVLVAIGAGDAAWAAEESSTRSFPATLRAGAAADLDGDGLQEAVSVYQDGVETRVHWVDDVPAGSTITDLQIATHTDVTHVTLGAGDLDGDGRDELIIGLTRDDAGELSIWKAADSGSSFQQQGETITYQPFSSGSSFAFRIATGDIDHDSRDEIALVRNEYFSTNGNPSGTSRYAILDDLTDGLTELANDDVAARDEFGALVTTVVADVSIGDVDGDAAGEVVFGALTQFNRDGCGSVHMVGFILEDVANGLSRQPGFEFRTSFSGCNSPARPDTRFAFTNCLDIDGDGRDEIHVNEHVFEDFADADPWTRVDAYSPPFTIVFSQNNFGTFGETTACMVVGDFTGDNREDIAIYQQENGLGIWGVDEVRGTIALDRALDIQVQTGSRPTNPVIVPVNIDRDGPVLSYSDASYKLVYSQPVPIAVLAAPPCVAGQQSGCKTSFGNTTSQSSESERSVSINVSATVGVKAQGSALTQSEFSLKSTATFAATKVQSRAYTLAKTVIFTSGEDEDTVVFTTVPLDQYTYTVLSHPDPDMVGTEVVVSLPRDPITIQAERTFYNNAVRGAFNRIDDTVFQHTIGDPDTYPTRSDKNQILNRRGGLEFGPQGVGQGTGETTLQIAVGNTIGEGGALEVGYEMELEATKFGVVGGITVGTTASDTWQITSGSETTYTGTVGAVADGSATYQWGMFTYVQVDSRTGRQYEVINYWVE